MNDLYFESLSVALRRENLSFQQLAILSLLALRAQCCGRIERSLYGGTGSAETHLRALVGLNLVHKTPVLNGNRRAGSTYTLQKEGRAVLARLNAAVRTPLVNLHAEKEVAA